MSEKKLKEIGLRKMECNVPYIVVKGSSNIFKIGDHLRKEIDDSIFCRETRNWLGEDGWKGLHTKVVIDIETIEEQIKKLQNEIQCLEKAMWRGQNDT